MPTGVIIDAASVILGGICGALLKDRMARSFQENLNMIFGVCSMAIGISSITLMENMPAVVLAVILGTALGMLLRLGDLVNAGAQRMHGLIARFHTQGASPDGAQDSGAALVTAIVLFCASGTGIYGAIVSGISGDHSILIAKSVLDLFTAMIFACSLGMVVSVIALPQLAIFLLLFFFAKRIYPLTTPSMINDFKACGGILMVATGFRIMRVRMFPTSEMIPSMILVMPLSWLWANTFLPLLS